MLSHNNYEIKKRNKEIKKETIQKKETLHKKNNDNNNENNNDLDVDINSDREVNANKIDTKYTVRREWKGQTNYFPGHDFEHYRPNDLSEDAKCKWDQQFRKRKEEIEKKLVKIFLKKDNVKLVPYSGRQRWSFPCPEKGCQFNSVDLGKDLMRKHKWKEDTVCSYHVTNAFQSESTLYS